MPKLIDVLPYEFETDFRDTQAFKYADLNILLEVDGTTYSWIGKHQNVLNWYILENGICIGWNENISRGWSFPVKKLSTTHFLYKKLKEDR